jgi:hypothetical protein
MLLLLMMMMLLLMTVAAAAVVVVAAAAALCHHSAVPAWALGASGLVIRLLLAAGFLFLALPWLRLEVLEARMILRTCVLSSMELSFDAHLLRGRAMVLAEDCWMIRRGSQFPLLPGILCIVNGGAILPKIQALSLVKAS